jgi:hypothetical protein
MRKNYLLSMHNATASAFSSAIVLAAAAAALLLLSGPSFTMIDASSIEVQQRIKRRAAGRIQAVKRQANAQQHRAMAPSCYMAPSCLEC